MLRELAERFPRFRRKLARRMPTLNQVSRQQIELLHDALADLRASWRPPQGSFHASAAVPRRLRTGENLPQDPAAPSLLRRLRHEYVRAAKDVASRGYANWPAQLIHGDWHPGNMIFQGRRVAAVIDFDSARLGPRVLDLAGGALQFSLTRAGAAPETIHKFHTVQQTRVLRHFPRLGNLQVLELPEGDSVPGAVARYEQSGLVEFAEPDYRVSAAMLPDDPRFLDGTLWALTNYGQSAGVPDAVHACAGLRVRIPQMAGTRSLNIAVAAGIILFEVMRRTDRR